MMRSGEKFRVALRRSESEKYGRLGSKLAVSARETELGTVRVVFRVRVVTLLLVSDFLHKKIRMAKRRVTIKKLKIAAITA